MTDGSGNPVSEAEEGSLAVWKPELLGIDGRALPVVTAPAAVLGRAGAEVDPADPEVVRLAADLVATMRVSPG